MRMEQNVARAYAIWGVAFQTRLADFDYSADMRRCALSMRATQRMPYTPRLALCYGLDTPTKLATRM